MTHEDIMKIEASLEIKLPDSYKSIMIDFPVPAYANNTETALWDNADALIGLNLRLRNREKYREPWPHNFFALGEIKSSIDAVDLNDDDDLKVYWFEGQHVDLDGLSLSLDDWLIVELDNLKAKLKSQSISPYCSPKKRQSLQNRSFISKNYFSISLIIIGAFVGFSLAKKILKR